MRTTPRGDTGWRLRPPKLDRQPSLCVCMCLTDREAAAAPHERGIKKYSAIPPNSEMGTVRPHVPYAVTRYAYQIVLFYVTPNCIYGIHLNYYPIGIDLSEYLGNTLRHNKNYV